MNTQSKPTWITLISLCSMCVAAFFFLVPLLTGPIAQGILSLIIAVALFDVVALWIMANKDAYEKEFPPRNRRDAPYRYIPVRQPVKKQAPDASDTKQDDQTDA